MDNKIICILNEQMKILFRGEALSVPSRHISVSDMYELRCFDIELIKAYMPYLDKDERKRARKTISMLEAQLDGIRYIKLMH